MEQVKSINKKEDGCLFCGRHDWLELHHCMPGRANRKKSDEDGLCVWLCHWHHNEPPIGVHYNKYNRTLVQQLAQRVYEKNHTRQDWMRRYGKNYL